jgi:hypothetical protein|nr:MAG TPA: large terminase [Caudoviricetes sp.]
MNDTRTKNKSFIKLWRELQRNEIDGAEEILYTKNNELDGIDIFDIYDGGNTDIQNFNAKLIEECKQNIWFFFREVVKVPIIETSDEYTKYIINVPSYILIKNFIKGIPTILVKEDFMPNSGIKTTLLLLTLYNDLILKGKSVMNLYNVFRNNMITRDTMKLLDFNFDVFLTLPNNYRPIVLLDAIYYPEKYDNDFTTFITKGDYANFITNLIISIKNSEDCKYIGYIGKFESPNVKDLTNNTEKTLKRVYDTILSKNMTEYRISVSDDFVELNKLNDKNKIVVLRA